MDLKAKSEAHRIKGSQVNSGNSNNKVYFKYMLANVNNKSPKYLKQESNNDHSILTNLFVNLVYLVNIGGGQSRRTYSVEI